MEKFDDMQIRTMKEEQIIYNEDITNNEKIDENIHNLHRKIDESIKNIQEMRAK